MPAAGVVAHGALRPAREAYQSQNLLKKATLQIIAWRFLDNDRLQSLSDAFRQLDTNGDGSLSLEEIQELRVLVSGAVAILAQYR